MSRKVPLEAGLAVGPFRVGQARAAGVGEGRLRGGDLLRPFHGVRATAASLSPRWSDYVPLLRPGDRFSHTTAGEIWGVPLPDRLRDQLHVTATAGLTRPRTKGVVGHESADSVHAVRHGVPVSDPPTMFRELASMLTVGELVAIGDYLVLDPRVLDPHDLRPYLTVEALRLAAAAMPGRGVRAARAAADLVRDGVESPKETALRLLLLGGGLPEPVCGYELGEPSGRSIGWFDLAWPQYRTIAEYDSDGHRTSTRQYDKDITRFDRAAAIDWRVVRVRSRGILVDPDDTLARVRAALTRGGWSPNRRNAPPRDRSRGTTRRLDE